MVELEARFILFDPFTRFYVALLPLLLDALQQRYVLLPSDLLCWVLLFDAGLASFYILIIICWVLSTTPMSESSVIVLRATFHIPFSWFSMHLLTIMMFRNITRMMLQCISCLLVTFGHWGLRSNLLVCYLLLLRKKKIIIKIGLDNWFQYVGN